MMEHNEPVDITQVSNGFMVKPIRNEGYPIRLDSIRVFSTFTGLVEYLADHFSYRGSAQDDDCIRFPAKVEVKNADDIQF